MNRRIFPWGADECMYLKVEVKASRRGVAICLTPQCHVATFYKRVLSNDLKDDVLRGVWAENRKLEMGCMWEGGGCNKWSVCPQQLAAGTAETHCASTLQRALTFCLSFCYDQPVTIKIQRGRWLNCGHIRKHSTKETFWSSVFLLHLRQTQ